MLQFHKCQFSELVVRLSQLFDSRLSQRDLALVILGMFAGRVGVARRLRAQAVTDALRGAPATTTLEIVLAYLEQISRGMSDDLPL